MAPPPTYTLSQILSFFQRIQFFGHEPYQLGDSSIRLPSGPKDLLAFLTSLQRHTLASIPFENLGIHYSASHAISLDPDALYHKIVEKKRGGYCMENNLFFLLVLRGLGFEVYSAGARVRMSTGAWEGWSHMVSIVIIGDQRYVIDVGFGANGPIAPLLLEEGWTSAAIEPAKMRVMKDFIEEGMSRGDGQKLWLYQHHIGVGESADWTTQYAFTETEFLPADYTIMNFWTSTARESWFTQDVVVSRMVLDDSGGALVGVEILNGGVVKRRVGGKTETLVECIKEEERVKALEEVFGIVLKEEERRGIRGLVSELKG